MPGPRVQSLRAELERSHDRVRAVVSQLDDDTIVNATENPNWRVREVLCHLVASEPGMVANARGMIGGSGGVPPDFRLHDWNARQVAKRAAMTRAELLAELDNNRRDTLEFLDSIADSDLDARGRHADLSEMSVEQLLQTTVRHEQAHIAEVEAALG